MTDKNDQAWQGRVERKLDEVAEAIVRLARMEERMLTLFKRQESYDAHQTMISNRMAEMEKITSNRGLFFAAMDKSVWIIIGVVAAWLLQKRG